MSKPTKDPVYREIRIAWDRVTIDSLKHRLQSELCGQAVVLDVRTLQAQGGISDPTVLVAIVGAGSAALTAIVVGLFKLLEGPHQKIVLRAKDGSSLEIPANTSVERIGELIALIHQMDVDRIRVVEGMQKASNLQQASAEQSLPADGESAAPEE